MTLLFVDDFERSDESYQFDITRVMFDVERRAYRVGRDSGCSCPTPFEDFNDDSDWGAPLSMNEAINSVLADHTVPSCLDDKLACVAAIRKHAQENGIR